MTADKRIFFNIIATYARSLFSLVCGLFTTRWVLMSLGEVDYGLYGVVGGLVVFVSILNNLLASAVGRFYAYSVGEAKKPGNEVVGLEECRKWFNTAVLIHTVVPLLLISIGYPIGEWAVRHYLTIPSARIVSCVWVWRCVCLSCLVAMVSVPYQAMYTAKQNIAELTVYGFVTTILNVLVLYYMVTHPSDWLVGYAVWMLLISVVPSVLIGVRAHYIYPECQFVREYIARWAYLKRVLGFSLYQILNGISGICANQGLAIVINRHLGPSSNATMTIANQVSAQTQTLSSSFANAFWPAVANAAGEHRMDLMRTLSFRACKFGALSLLIFCIPLCLEINEVMRLWLKTPPVMSSELIIYILICAVLEKMTYGHWMGIFAVGDIAGYQISVSISGFLAIILGGLFVCRGFGILGVGYALIIVKQITIFIRLYYASKVAKMSIRYWFIKVALPIFCVTIVCVLAGLLPRMFFNSSFVRILLTIGIVEIFFLLLSWFLVFDSEERFYIREKIFKRIRKIF